jgi:trimeric autotransporter adhesin
VSQAGQQGSGTPAYVSAVLNTGPSPYWSLGDASGAATASDLAGGGNPGNYSASGITYGVASPVEGSGGRGVTLDGVSGHVVSSRAAQSPAVYSEALWFNTTTTRGGALATYGNGATGQNTAQDRQVWVTPSGQIEFGVWTGQTVTVRSAGSYNDGKWHFMVATQGADGMHLYIDGQAVGSNPNTQAQSYGGYWQLGIGVNGGWPDSTTNPYAGSLSDAAFYSGTELTPAQVQTLFAAG